MKKFALIITAIIAGLVSSAQEKADTLEFVHGSKVSIQDLSSFQIESLSLLGKVWGFLKYYHPTIAEGTYNWDFELFRILPSYLQVENGRARDRLLVNWIDHFGKIPSCKKCDSDTVNFKIKPDLSWINDKSLSDSLKTILNFVKDNRHQGKKYYVELVASVQNPNILNENPYQQFIYPDAGYRLLALFRYWNIIQYWFPDKHLIGEDWKDVLLEFIPKFIAVNNEMEYWNTAQQLIARIHDTHANLICPYPGWNNRHGKYYAPVMVTFVGDDPVVSVLVNERLAALSNLQRGDIVKAVDGKKVKDIITERLPNLPASNYPTQLRDLSSQLLRSKDSITTITIERDGKEMECRIHHFIPGKWSDWYRYDFPYQQDSSFFFIQPGIGYINLGAIKKRQVDSVFKVLEGSKGLIIDDRQYPSDFPLYHIAYELNSQRTPFTKTTVGNLNFPGSFSELKNLVAGGEKKEFYKGEVIILVNENTQSSAEFHTMAFQIAPNSMVVGSTTAGADGNVTNFFYLPGGVYTRFSGIGILYPDGRETQRVGIVPDLEVKRTAKGIKEGRDELVEKAIELINNDRKAF